jgi:hypothetical protein
MAGMLDGTAAVVPSSRVKITLTVGLPRESRISSADTRFSTTPTGMMEFADLMQRAGSIKVKPADWRELFVDQIETLPEAESRLGSDANARGIRRRALSRPGTKPGLSHCQGIVAGRGGTRRGRAFMKGVSICGVAMSSLGRWPRRSS